MHIDQLPENDRFLHLFTNSDSVSTHLNVFFVYFSTVSAHTVVNPIKCGAAAVSAGYNRDRLTAVAAQRKEECVQLLVICADGLNQIFFSKLCSRQIHIDHLFCRLGYAN